MTTVFLTPIEQEPTVLTLVLLTLNHVLTACFDPPAEGGSVVPLQP